MEHQQFNEILTAVVGMGYGHDVEWQENLTPCDNSHDFFLETSWVILNSGMKEQIARIIWDRIKNAWHEGKLASDVFGHKGKSAALEFVRENHASLFAAYIESNDKITFLQTIPFIGKITCWHLAKNLGHDVVKPDRHLVRIAATYGRTPDELCEKISKETGYRKCVVDIVLWRAANLKLI
jgi:hypothetical protein